MTTRGRRSDRRLRAPLWSPGRPGVARRDDRRRFWLAIAAGRSSEDAAWDGGASQAVGSRWAQKAGGMPPSHRAPSAPLPLGRHLSFAEGEEIALLKAQDHGVREIARRVGRAPRAVSRELRKRRGDAQRPPGVPGDDRAVARRGGRRPRSSRRTTPFGAM